MYRRFFATAFLVALATMALLVGCQSNDNNPLSAVQQVTTPTVSSERASLSFSIALAPQGAPQASVMVVGSGTATPSVDITVYSVGRDRVNSTPTVATHVDLLSSNEVATVTIPNLPILPTYVVLQVNNGLIASQNHFIGALDLAAGANTVKVLPYGSKHPSEIAAHVLSTIMNDSAFLQRAPIAKLVSEIRNVYVASQTSWQPATIYTDVENAFRARYPVQETGYSIAGVYHFVATDSNASQTMWDESFQIIAQGNSISSMSFVNYAAFNQLSNWSFDGTTLTFTRSVISGFNGQVMYTEVWSGTFSSGNLINGTRIGHGTTAGPDTNRGTWVATRVTTTPGTGTLTASDLIGTWKVIKESQYDTAGNRATLINDLPSAAGNCDRYVFATGGSFTNTEYSKQDVGGVRVCSDTVSSNKTFTYTYSGTTLLFTPTGGSQASATLTLNADGTVTFVQGDGYTEVWQKVTTGSETPVATQPADVDRTAIEAVVTTWANAQITKYSRQTVTTADADAVVAVMSPSFLEDGITSTAWRSEYLAPLGADEGNLVSANLTGWQYLQISSDTWMVAGLGTLTKTDWALFTLADLSKAPRYSADLKTITFPNLDSDTSGEYLWMLVRKETGVWKLLGNQRKFGWASPLLHFNNLLPSNSRNACFWPNVDSFAQFPIATITVSGSFINGTARLVNATGTTNWRLFDSAPTTYQGVPPNTPGAIITMVILFTDGSTQTLCFSQPDTSAMAALVGDASVSASGITLTWNAATDASNFDRYSLQIMDGSTTIAKQSINTITTTSYTFPIGVSGVTSGRSVFAHVHLFQRDQMVRHFYKFVTIP